MTHPISPPSLRTPYDTDAPQKPCPRIYQVTEAQSLIEPEIDPMYDRASFTRREAVASSGLMGAHGMLRHGRFLASGALAIAAMGLIIGFHAWQDQTVPAVAGAGNDELMVVETVSDNATTLLLAGTLAKLVGVPRTALIQQMDARPASAPRSNDKPASAKVASVASLSGTFPSASAQPVWLARTVNAVAALPATLSPARLFDPITHAVRQQVRQGLSFVGIADNLATVSAIIDRFQLTLERTLPDALERATLRR
jgi:hypothetical protein